MTIAATAATEPRPDGALSSVIAAVLLVGITLAIAAMIVVWVQGFTGFGDPAPRADIGVLSCNVDSDAVTAELKTGGPLEAADLAASIENVSSGVSEARSDPLSGSTTWETRSRLTISHHEDDEPRWEDPLASPGGLAPETRYEIRWIHVPSSSVFTADRFRCGPAETPEPRLEFVSCRAQNDEFTARLTSDQALDRSSWNADLVNRSDGATEAAAAPMGGNEVWRPGSALTFHEPGPGSGVAWDDDLDRGLEAGGAYRLEITYRPTGTTQSSPTFTC